MSKPIPDYTESLIWAIAESLKNAFARIFEIQLPLQSDYQCNNKHELKTAE